MSCLTTCSPAQLGVLGTIWLTLVVVAGWTLVESYVLCRGTWRMWVSAGALALTTWCCWLIALVFSLRVGKRVMMDASLHYAGQVPTLFAVALTVLTGVCLLMHVHCLYRERLTHVTPDSVKDALDALPDAVCFSQTDGRPLLVNGRMDTLAHDVLETWVQDEGVLWEWLCAGELKDGYTVSNVERSRGHALLVTPAGDAWEFRRSTIEQGGRDVVETVAVDVSDEYALARVLGQRNERLEQVNAQLRDYDSNLVRLVRSEEVLAAKIRVHDEIGRALAALRVYEASESEERDRDELIRLWHGIAELLQAAGVSDSEPQAEPWALLEAAAQAVGVRLTLEGDLPDGGAARSATVAVAHECLNNAVRHGGAHEVRVQVSGTRQHPVVRITNDGTVPAGPVGETGGLADMRALVERANGTMEVAWTPRFEVTVRF